MNACRRQWLFDQYGDDYDSDSEVERQLRQYSRPGGYGVKSAPKHERRSKPKPIQDHFCNWKRGSKKSKRDAIASFLEIDPNATLEQYKTKEYWRARRH